MLALADRLTYAFVDHELLVLAVTHRSYCAENAGHESNERLEFLGDAVLSIVVTDHIFASFPTMPEGEMAKLRAAVVSAATLAEVGGEIALGEAMRLGKGENASGGRHKPSILADGMEAVFGAIYLDGGIDAVRPLILRLLDDRIVAAADGPGGPGGADFKTQLQELAARHFDELPSYALRDEGPDHEKRFFATVSLGGYTRGSGEGRSKKQAEQDAAHAAWLALEREVRSINGSAGVLHVPSVPGAPDTTAVPAPSVDGSRASVESERSDA